MRIERAARSIIDLVVQCIDPEVIYMFGSAAQGRARPDSDVDLLIVARFQEPRQRRGLELRGLLAAGAAEVLWLRVMREHLDEGAADLLSRTDPSAPLICESNSLRRVVDPGIFLMLRHRDDRSVKPREIRKVGMARVQ